MTRIAYFGLLALLPIAADSQSEPTGAGTDLQGWSIAQRSASRTPTAIESLPARST